MWIGGLAVGFGAIEDSAMPTKRVSLFHYDVLRELCADCRREHFHFVPIGAAPATGDCRQCGSKSGVVDMSDSAIMRLVTLPSGEFTVVPVIRGS
jgi:hypothetical protein